MRNLVFALLFPFALAAQSLPDSAIAAKLGVKKLVVLIECDTLPVDTAAVLFFDKGQWKTADGISASEPERKARGVYNAKGQLIFAGSVPPPKHCTNDTVGWSYAYDAAGRVVRKKSFSCEKGDATWFYTYDSFGRPVLEVNDPPLPYVGVTRTEYVYDNAGRLHSVTGWWTGKPYNAARDSTERASFRIEYTYDRRGLPVSLMVDDPFHNFDDNPGWFGPGWIGPPPPFIYRYVYTFAD